MDIKLCFIKEIYFLEHESFIKMLDSQNFSKQSKRIHLCLKIVNNNNNTFYIPLRNHLGDEIRKYGRIGHSVPSNKRPLAGLDYRYSLLINDNKYIEEINSIKIPKSQYKKICNDYEKINQEFSVYINGFIKAIRKNRVLQNPLYRESSLLNFVDILRE